MNKIKYQLKKLVIILHATFCGSDTVATLKSDVFCNVMLCITMSDLQNVVLGHSEFGYFGTLSIDGRSDVMVQ